MVSGPLGARRPLAGYRVIINTNIPTISIQAIGPFGLPRPFSKNNPPVTEERIAECTISDAGRAFGAGSLTMGETTDISDLPPEAQQEAINRAESWCEGLMESTSEEELGRGEAAVALEGVKEQVQREIEAPEGTTFERIE